MNLIDSIRLGESKTLELKAQLPQHDQIAKTAVAFSNTSGGKLLIGVGDNCDVIGLLEEDVLALQERIGSIIFDRCYPAILPSMYTANLEGKVVLVVEIFRGNLLPYYLKEEGKDNGTYLRVGIANRKADFEHVLELERQKRNQSFDEEIFCEQPLVGLDLTPLSVRFEAAGKPLNDEKLRNLKLVREEQGSLYPTQGLMILLGKLPHVTVKCARFKGRDMRVFLDRKEYEGDLFTQLEQTEGFVKNHISLRGEIKGLQRTDTYELPEAALREALINAVIHRDYTNQGRDIKVGVYDDIVNVVSPGGFPSSLTAEALQEGRSEIRNRVVARVFKELGYIEQWGSGIQRIKSTCIAIGLAEPRIREKGDFVDVEFYRPATELTETGRLRTIPDEKVPNTTQNRTITPEKGSDKAGFVPDTYMKVPDSARVVPDTYISVPDSTEKMPDIFVQQRSKIINHIHQHGRITAPEAEVVLSVKERRARVVLRELVQKGLLKKQGRARSTYYVLPPSTE